MKEQFISLLSQANCPQQDIIIENLEKLGFFEAPASTKYHLARKGGLAEHSVTVCRTALSMRETAIQQNPALEEKLPLKSVILAALLHDVCKAEIYKESLRNVKNDKTGVWEKVPYYDIDCSHFPMGHGEKSVIRLLLWGVKLNESEMLAIRWHMAAWDLPFQSHELMANLNAAKQKSPLVVLIQCADQTASAIFEE